MGDFLGESLPQSRLATGSLCRPSSQVAADVNVKGECETDRKQVLINVG